MTRLVSAALAVMLLIAGCAQGGILEQVQDAQQTARDLQEAQARIVELEQQLADTQAALTEQQEGAKAAEQAGSEEPGIIEQVLEEQESQAAEVAATEGPSTGDLSAQLPADMMGYFVVSDGTPVPMQQFWQNVPNILSKEDFSIYPSVQSVFPVVLLRSDSVNIGTLALLRMRMGLGMVMNRNMGPVVAGVIEESPAEAMGLQAGDTIVSVNGVDVGGSLQKATDLISSVVNQPVELEVLRGTQMVNLSGWPRPIGDFDRVSFTYQVTDNGYVQLFPKKGLMVDGLYCYTSITSNNQQERWCFLISPISEDEAVQEPTTEEDVTGQPVTDEGIIISVSATEGWQDTGAFVNQGETVTIEYVSGEWSPWSGEAFDAEGVPRECEEQYEHCVVCGVCHASLVGRIGTGEPFQIGNEETLVATETGTIALRINDDMTGDNFGSITVRISR